MIDHAKRINKNRRIAEMNKNAKQIFLPFLIIALIVTGDYLVNLYADYKYSGSLETQHEFVQCLNGIKLQLSETESVGCTIQKMNLTEGTK